MTLGRRFVVGAGQEPDRSVTGAVGEPPPGEPGLATGENVRGNDRPDTAGVGLHLEHMLVQKQREVLFGRDHL
jgi:hypothetical protein